MDKKIKQHVRSVTDGKVSEPKKKIQSNSQRSISIDPKLVKQWHELMETVEKKATYGESS